MERKSLCLVGIRFSYFIQGQKVVIIMRKELSISLFILQAQLSLIACPVMVALNILHFLEFIDEVPIADCLERFDEA